MLKQSKPYAMTNVAQIFSRYGVTALSAYKAGMSYQTVWCHLRGTRKVSAQNALNYERLVGIPRWELRPDLWESPLEPVSTKPTAEKTANDCPSL